MLWRISPHSFCELHATFPIFRSVHQVLLWTMSSFFVNLDVTFPILKNVHQVLLWTMSSFFVNLDVMFPILKNVHQVLLWTMSSFFVNLDVTFPISTRCYCEQWDHFLWTWMFISYFEKCPPGVIVNKWVHFLWTWMQRFLFWEMSTWCYCEHWVHFFLVNFSGWQSNNWWFNKQFSPSHSWLHAKQMTCNQLWPYWQSLTNLLSCKLRRLFWIFTKGGSLFITLHHVTSYFTDCYCSTLLGTPWVWLQVMKVLAATFTFGNGLGQSGVRLPWTSKVIG